MKHGVVTSCQLKVEKYGKVINCCRNFLRALAWGIADDSVEFLWLNWLLPCVLYLR